MDLWYTLVFTVFPYLCLTTFVLGHGYRYLTDRYGWNARSSEFLEKKTLFPGTVLFHWGIVFTFLGHAAGLLMPQRVLDRFGVGGETHLVIAFWSGLAVGAAAFAGALLLLRRRMTEPRMQAVHRLNDTVTIGALVLVVGAGLYNVIFGHYNVLYTVAPWIRGIVTFTPDAMLMKAVPLSYKIHVTAAWLLLGFSPFSRLIHIWSAPVTYFFRPWIVFRRYVRQS
jgi:nitrate reductase gamma subunit